MHTYIHTYIPSTGTGFQLGQMLTGTNTSQTGGIFGQQQTPASSGFSLAPTTQTKGPSGQSGFQQGQLGGGGGGLKLSTSTAQSGLSLGGGLSTGTNCFTDWCKFEARNNNTVW
jgi:hypothetical protein